MRGSRDAFSASRLPRCCLPLIEWALMKRRLAVLLTLLAALTAGAQASCELELGQLDRGLPADMPAGTRAAQLLYGAVELVEPALPAWQFNATVPLPAEQAGYAAVQYLVGRDLLPDSWQADELDRETWHEMLGRFLGWYELELAETDLDRLNGTDPSGDLAQVLDLIGEAVRPVAIIAHDDNQDVAFLGVIWNWSSYPRLLVHRIPAGTSVRSGTQSVLADISNCAVRFERYASAPVATAWRLFVGSGDSLMYVLAADPWRPQLPVAVEQQQVMDYLEFMALEVNGASQFSAAFSGQEIGLGAILGMITQIRTNVSPVRLGHYLEVPSSP